MQQKYIFPSPAPRQTRCSSPWWIFRRCGWRAPLACLVLVALLALSPSRAWGQGSKLGIDFFSGLDLALSDNNFIRQYNVFVGLTPGFKFDMGSHWQLAAQGKVCLANTYNNNLRRVYLNMLVLSKEMMAGPVCLKGSAGLFGNARYGFDIKAFLPVTRWLAFEAQAGYTGLLSMATGWAMSPIVHLTGSTLSFPGRFTGTVGGDIYIPYSNTQLRGVVGKYVYTDWGVEAEIMRHFNHATIGLYAKWNNIAGELNREGVTLAQSMVKGVDGGFRVTVVIPPYRRTRRAVKFRPASNFSTTYLIRGTNQYLHANQLYITDPEENMRHGWFSRDLLQWGSNTMEPDFKYQLQQSGNETGAGLQGGGNYRYQQKEEAE